MPVTFTLSLGRWYGFYLDIGYLVRIGLGFLEVGFALREGGETTHFLENVMRCSGRAADAILRDPMSTGRKLPIGFMALNNGQPAELRLEVETNRQKFVSTGEDPVAVSDVPGPRGSAPRDDGEETAPD